MEDRLKQVTLEKEKIEHQVEDTKRKMVNMNQQNQSQDQLSQKSRQQVEQLEKEVNTLTSQVNTLRLQLNQATERANNWENTALGAKKEHEQISLEIQKVKLELTTARNTILKKDQDYESMENKYLEVYKENIMLKSSQNYKI